MLITKFHSEGKFNQFLEDLGMKRKDGFTGEIEESFEENGREYFLKGAIFGKGYCHINVSEEVAVGFKAETRGTTRYYEKAVKEWCRINHVDETAILVDTSSLTDEDKELVVDVFNHDKTIATLDSVVQCLPLLKEKFMNGVKELYLVANPFDVSQSTVCYIPNK